jgi:hypothetical protein
MKKIKIFFTFILLSTSLFAESTFNTNVTTFVDNSTFSVAKTNRYPTVNINSVNVGAFALHKDSTNANITLLANSAFFISNGGTNVSNGEG